MSALNLGFRISALRIDIHIDFIRGSVEERIKGRIKAEERLKTAEAAKEGLIRHYHQINGY